MDRFSKMLFNGLLNHLIEVWFFHRKIIRRYQYLYRIYICLSNISFFPLTCFSETIVVDLCDWLPFVFSTFIITSSMTPHSRHDIIRPLCTLYGSDIEKQSIYKWCFKALSHSQTWSSYIHIQYIKISPLQTKFYAVHLNTSYKFLLLQRNPINTR